MAHGAKQKLCVFSLDVLCNSANAFHGNVSKLDFSEFVALQKDVEGSFDQFEQLKANGWLLYGKSKFTLKDCLQDISSDWLKSLVSKQTLHTLKPDSFDDHESTYKCASRASGSLWLVQCQVAGTVGAGCFGTVYDVSCGDAHFALKEISLADLDPELSLACVLSREGAIELLENRLNVRKVVISAFLERCHLRNLSFLAEFVKFSYFFASSTHTVKIDLGLMSVETEKVIGTGKVLLVAEQVNNCLKQMLFNIQLDNLDAFIEYYKQRFEEIIDRHFDHSWKVKVARAIQDFFDCFMITEKVFIEQTTRNTNSLTTTDTLQLSAFPLSSWLDLSDPKNPVFCTLSVKYESNLREFLDRHVEIFHYCCGVRFRHGVVSMMKSLAIQIDSLHKTGCCHRDVKPTNIVGEVIKATTEFNEWEHKWIEKGSFPAFVCRLCDFGLARAMNQTTDKSDVYYTSMSKSLGDCGYTAPEVLAGEKYDENIDVYSLAVIFAEVLLRRAGKRAIESVISAFQQSNPPRTLQWLFPDECSILIHALDPNPLTRPSASWLEQQLESLELKLEMLLGDANIVKDDSYYKMKSTTLPFWQKKLLKRLQKYDFALSLEHMLQTIENFLSQQKEMWFLENFNPDDESEFDLLADLNDEPMEA